MHFTLNDLTKIQGVLKTLSEPSLVDAVDCLLSQEPKAAVAVFKCEHFGECIVYRFLDDITETLTEDDLHTMADIANDELDRIVMTNGWGSMTDHEVDLGHADVPIGFAMEFRTALN